MLLPVVWHQSHPSLNRLVGDKKQPSAGYDKSQWLLLVWHAHVCTQPLACCEDCLSHKPSSAALHTYMHTYVWGRQHTVCRHAT